MIYTFPSIFESLQQNKSTYVILYITISSYVDVKCLNATFDMK